MPRRLQDHSAAKLLYGMESAQLTPAQQKRLEIFHLKGLRKILKIKTTFVDRTKSHAEVYRLANEKIKEHCPERKKPKTIIPFSHAYKNAKTKRIAKIFKLDRQHPVRFATFKTTTSTPTNTLQPWDPPNK